MPGKSRLEFISIVSTDCVQAKREFLDHVVDAPDGVFLGMLWIDSQGLDTVCIVVCCILVTLQLATTFVYKSRKLNINLYVMTRDLFLVALIDGYRALATILWQRIQPMSLEHVVDAFA